MTAPIVKQVKLAPLPRRAVLCSRHRERVAVGRAGCGETRSVCVECGL